jgi:hypothetical protein
MRSAATPDTTYAAATARTSDAMTSAAAITMSFTPGPRRYRCTRMARAGRKIVRNVTARLPRADSGISAVSSSRRCSAGPDPTSSGGNRSPTASSANMNAIPASAMARVIIATELATRSVRPCSSYIGTNRAADLSSPRAADVEAIATTDSAKASAP